MLAAAFTHPACSLDGQKVRGVRAPAPRSHPPRRCTTQAKTPQQRRACTAGLARPCQGLPPCTPHAHACPLAPRAGVDPPQDPAGHLEGAGHAHGVRAGGVRAGGGPCWFAPVVTPPYTQVLTVVCIPPTTTRVQPVTLRVNAQAHSMSAMNTRVNTATGVQPGFSCADPPVGLCHADSVLGTPHPLIPRQMLTP